MSDGLALVTGAGGFVGGCVARRLADESLLVRAMVRDPDKPCVVGLDPPGVELVVADLTRPSTLDAAADGADLVVHAAADMRLREPAVTRAVTVEGTRRMLAAARKAGARLFIHVSSVAVYFGGDRGDEEAPLLLYGDLYGDAKIGAEMVLHEADGRPGPEIVILRPPAVYGPHSRLWTATTSRIVRLGLPALVGDGRTYFPYVYVDNLMDAVMAAVVTAGRHQGIRVYNVVDGATTWAHYFSYLARAHGRRVRSMPFWLIQLMALGAEAASVLMRRPLQPTRASLRMLERRDLPGYTSDKARRELSWQPRVDLDVGMRRSLEWLEQERALESASAS